MVLWWSSGGGLFLMSEVPLYGTYQTVKARIWPWLSGESRQNRLSCSLFARHFSPPLQVRMQRLQGYLARKKHPPPRTLQ